MKLTNNIENEFLFVVTDTKYKDHDIQNFFSKGKL